MKTVCVILTVFNRKEKTLLCLKNLFDSANHFKQHNKYKLDVYLTDDGSTDGTSNAIKKEYSKVKVLEGNGNLYWNRGMLNSWKEASKNEYDYFLWINDDTFLIEDALTILFNDSIKLKNRAIICGSTQSEITKEVTYGGRTKKGELLTPNGNLQQCYYTNGNLVLIPKVIFDTIGMLDSFYHHGLGDFDYGIRAQKAGFKCYITSKFVGNCEKNGLNNCFNPKVKISKRLKILYTPLGVNPKKQFYYDKRSSNIFRASKNFISIHIRTILPKLWLQK